MKFKLLILTLISIALISGCSKSAEPQAVDEIDETTIEEDSEAKEPEYDIVIPELPPIEIDPALEDIYLN